MLFTNTHTNFNTTNNTTTNASPTPTPQPGNMLSSKMSVPLVEPAGATKTPMDNYRLEKVLGQGSYAVVRLAYDKTTNARVAIKTYEKYKLYDIHRRKNVKREIAILSQMDHMNIIKMPTWIETPTQYNLVMEYVSDRSLYSYLKSKPTRRVSESEARNIFKQITAAIDYCHSRSIAHRDVKLENIILDDQSRVKLIDFGFAIACSKERLNVFCGTPSYMAPEIVSKKEYFGPPVDVWSLGIVMFSLICGKFPFKGTDEKDLYRKIAKGQFEIPAEVSHTAKSLLQKILVVNPAERITTRQILQDPWITFQPNSTMTKFGKA